MSSGGRLPVQALLSICACALLIVPARAAGRVGTREEVALDGIWDVGESVAQEARPSSFSHRAPVPGLAHSAVPAFPDVDRFDSREAIANQVMSGEAPESTLVASAGVSRQGRNYFWYRTYFSAPARRELAILTVNKAQFGSEIWINGRHVGEHTGCSTSASYNITQETRWSSRNEVVIRIGAHPGVLPEGNPCGVDFEKSRWTPGIYDKVSLAFTDALTIVDVQVVPHVEPRGIRLQATLRNTSNTARRAVVDFSIQPYPAHPDAGRIATARAEVNVDAGGISVVDQTIALPAAKLWTPDEPNLYVLTTSTRGDRLVTRFGIREFHFDTVTRRAYLNGKPYFLRGSNIALHRFFEDPESGQLPWDEHWVRKLLGDKAKQMHWNAMRMHIGAVPQRWLDIADEEGLLVQYEFPIWVSSPRTLPRRIPLKRFDTDELVTEMSQWVRDARNHPSVVIWNACNESELPVIGQTIIPSVRRLDLSNRPWGNGYNPPVGSDDPVDDHVYEYMPGKQPFDMVNLEQAGPSRQRTLTPFTGHALILNEYGWLWLNRDGTPSELTKGVYPSLPYPHTTAEERLETQAYLLAGLTEYWRATRQYAGVMEFAYLTSSIPHGFTGDHFREIRSLEFQPYFQRYVAEAFKPLGVYINFWRRELPTGAEQTFQVSLINDGADVRGKLSLTIENAVGQAVGTSEASFAVSSNGQQTYFIVLKLPREAGSYQIKAVAQPVGPPQVVTASIRRVNLVTSVIDDHAGENQRPSVDSVGTVHIPDLAVPASAHMSDEARQRFIDNFKISQARARQDDAASDQAGPSSACPGRSTLDDYLRPIVERAKVVYPVDVEREFIGGVPADVITPKGGVTSHNANRILIGLHGGGYGCQTAGGLLALAEAIPISGAGHFKVVSIDYRTQPNHYFPAATEDVATVYRALLKKYRSQSIGLFGCSTGATLSAGSVAWFQREKLPRPGAIGLFGEGATKDDHVDGDSWFINVPLVGGPLLAANQSYQVLYPEPYMAGTTYDDPLVAPVAFPKVLSKFPPTLVISGTRDLGLSEAVYTHTQLVKAGVDAELHVWEGQWHCAYVDVDLPESLEMHQVAARFFQRHLR